MSLFESASLVVTPNGVKASKLYAIKPTDGSGDLTVTRATTATRVNSSGLIESVANNTPRLDYTNGSCPSILVEPQRTNLLVRSEEFNDTAWVKINSTVTANTAISPSGLMNADSLTFTATGGFHLIEQNVSLISGISYTASYFVKNNGQNFIQIFSTGVFGITDYANFNLSDGTISASLGLIGTIKNYNDNWYKITATKSANSTGIGGLNISSIPNGTSGWRPSHTGSGASVYIYGAQLEQGAFPTSYIPTVASTVTRNADVISKTGISSLIGQTEGTIYSEIKVSKLLGTASRYIFHLSDGTANNRIYMAFSGSSSNILRGRIFNGGVLQATIGSSTITNLGTYKLALAYKNNDIVFYINGVQIGTDTSATIPTCSRVDVGHNQAGISQFSDGITSAIAFKTRLTNSELATLTTL